MAGKRKGVISNNLRYDLFRIHGGPLMLYAIQKMLPPNNLPTRSTNEGRTGRTWTSILHFQYSIKKKKINCIWFVFCSRKCNISRITLFHRFSWKFYWTMLKHLSEISNSAFKSKNFSPLFSKNLVYLISNWVIILIFFFLFCDWMFVWFILKYSVIVETLNIFF